MNTWWFALDQVVSETDCDALIDLYKQPNPGKVGFHKESMNDFVRKVSIQGFAYNTAEHKIISKILDPLVQMANREAFGFDISGISEFQISKYRQAEYYKEHMDCFLKGIPSQRKLSITLQLSDQADYEGGEFVFNKDIPGLPNEVKNKGSIIVFPSFLYHQVMPVTKGDRYSLVGWYEGPQWK